MSSVEMPMLRRIRPQTPSLDAHPPRLENQYPLRPRCSFIQFPAELQFTLVACILSMMLLMVAPVSTRMSVPPGGTGPVFLCITLRGISLSTHKLSIGRVACVERGIWLLVLLLSCIIY